jgi:sugar transferase (PEP-CTERM/EpsH1 system associated)
MHQQLRSWAREVAFDVVVAFSSSMAQYALAVPAGRRVLDLCDRDSQKWLDYAKFSTLPARLLYRAEGRRLAQLEERWLNDFDATIVITEAEAGALREKAPVGKLHVIGNGAHIAPGDKGRSGALSATREARPRGPIVGFVGAMDYRPNIDGVHWFVDRCWPRVRARFPTALFRIVGRSPVRSVRRLARSPGVVVVGEVADVASEVPRFDVSIAPLRIARGLQNKVLEAFSYGRPVVATGKVAAGLVSRQGVHYLRADTPESFSQAVCDLLDDPAARQRLGRAAREHVAAAYRWDVELDRFAALVAGAGFERSPTAVGHTSSL